MINSATVFTKGGALLWSKNESGFNPIPINKLIQNVILQEHSGESLFKYSVYNIKWLSKNDLDIIFAVVYLNISSFLKIDQLLDAFKNGFCALHRDKLPRITLIQQYNYDFTAEFAAIEASLYEVQKSVQKASQYAQNANKPFERKNLLHAPASAANSTDAEAAGEDFVIDADTESLQTTWKDGRESTKRARGAGPFPKEKPTSPAKDHPRTAAGKSAHPKKEFASKEKRTWSDKRLSRKEKMALDYSKESTPQAGGQLESFGGEGEGGNSKVGEGTPNFSSSEETEEDLPASEECINGRTRLTQKLAGIFNRLASKKLTEQEIAPAITEMEKTLIDKNVAVEVARNVCASVRADIEGKMASKFSLTSRLVREAFYASLVRIITPSKPVHFLRAIASAKEAERTFSVAFVGVNGVGKSTTLAKVAFYLQRRNLKVSVAACDTFRSGAVEQLLTHSRALGFRVFQKGYAKDASQVCAQALREAQRVGDDVVLIDTAGRMQNNEPLMKSLKKLVDENRPDLVIFVGEALVGNEALDQLDKFSGQVAIDGIVLTKFDVVDDKVGAAISMTYRTKRPILFLGTGQTYETLKKANPEILAKQLLS